MSFAVSLASVALLGPYGAALVGASAILSGQRRLTPPKRLFNGAQFALSGYFAGLVFHGLGSQRCALGEVGWVSCAIGPFIASLVTFVAANFLLMAGILILGEQETWRDLLVESGPLLAGCLGFGVFGLFIAVLWPLLGLVSAVLVLTPLLTARWAFTQIQAQQRAQRATLAALCQAVETKDFYTRGHSERVSLGSERLAREIGMKAPRVEGVRRAGMLHDVGKLGVPTKVLQKAGALTDEEYAAVQLHPMRGLQIVRGIEFLSEALAGIMHHHERMDGTGYPMGLAGKEIPEFARIIAIVDAFDSMTTTRFYRRARSVEDAIAELQRCSGTHFDPEMVEAFVRILEGGWQLPGAEELPVVGEFARRDHDDPSCRPGIKIV